MPSCKRLLSMLSFAGSCIFSFVWRNQEVLLHRPYFHGDFVNLAGKGSLRADADTLGDRCLIVEANLGCLFRREDHALGVFDARLRHFQTTYTRHTPQRESEFCFQLHVGSKNRVNSPFRVYAPSVGCHRNIPSRLCPVNTSVLEPSARLPIGEARPQGATFNKLPVESASNFISKISFQDVRCVSGDRDIHKTLAGEAQSILESRRVWSG